MDIQQHFYDLLQIIGANNAFIVQQWQQLSKKYNEPTRAYHNLRHIAIMLQGAIPFRSQIVDAATLNMAIFYHDIVYDPLRNDNELQSAILVKKVLTQLNYPLAKIEQCYQQILATKKHEFNIPSPSFDSQLLIDLDLVILGQPWQQYAIYTQQIRKEYSMYPLFLYKKGRKKAMTRFLNRDKIYHTPQFIKQYEQQARANIEREIEELL